MSNILIEEYNDLMRFLMGKSPMQTDLLQDNISTNSGFYQSPLRGEAKLISRHTPGAATPTHPRGHFGLDLSQSKGSPVYSVGPGIVAQTGVDKKGGNFVTTHHENGKLRVYYAHLDSITTQQGQAVDMNTVIGTVGNTGNARYTSPHLHYQMKLDGNWLDPLKLNGKPVGFSSKQANQQYRINQFKKFGQ